MMKHYVFAKPVGLYWRTSASPLFTFQRGPYLLHTLLDIINGGAFQNPGTIIKIVIEPLIDFFKIGFVVVNIKPIKGFLKKFDPHQLYEFQCRFFPV